MSAELGARMRRQPILVWIGLGFYAVSFFLYAVEGIPLSSGPARGYACAISSLFDGATSFVSDLRGEATFVGMREAVALFCSGMINVFFLAFAGLRLYGRARKVYGEVLRVLVVVLFPACWIVFQSEGIRPLWGYYIWMAGMVTVLFAGGSRERETDAARL
jgi:hypothetical protein